jgi:hypothetical protein
VQCPLDSHLSPPTHLSPTSQFPAMSASFLRCRVCSEVCTALQQRFALSPSHPRRNTLYMGGDQKCIVKIPKMVVFSQSQLQIAPPSYVCETYCIHILCFRAFFEIFFWLVSAQSTNSMHPFRASMQVAHYSCSCFHLHSLWFVTLESNLLCYLIALSGNFCTKVRGERGRSCLSNTRLLRSAPSREEAKEGSG